MDLRGARIWVFVGMAVLAAVVARGAGFAVEQWVSTPLRFFPDPSEIRSPPTPELLLKAARFGDRAVVAMFGLCLALQVAIAAIASFFYLAWRDKKHPPVAYEPFDWSGIVVRYALAFAVSEGVMLALWCAMRGHLPTLPGGVATWSLSAGLSAAGFILLRYRSLARWPTFAVLLLLVGIGVAVALVDGPLLLRPTPWLALAGAACLLWRPVAMNRQLPT